MMMDRWVHRDVPSDPLSADWSRCGEASAGRGPLAATSGQNDRVHTDPQRNDGAPGAAEVRMLTTSVVYADNWARLRRDEIERCDGSSGNLRGRGASDNFALIIPAENGGFHLVEEYRHPLGRRGWSFPQGSFPKRRGRNVGGAGAHRARPGDGPARRPADPPRQVAGRGARHVQPVRRALAGHGAHARASPTLSRRSLACGTSGCAGRVRGDGARRPDRRHLHAGRLRAAADGRAPRRGRPASTVSP